MALGSIRSPSNEYPEYFLGGIKMAGA